MIKKIRNSLTVKICILVAVLLVGVSCITYGAIIGFLPTYYSNQLQEDLDTVSQGMIDTISSYDTIEEAFYAIELFEASSQVSVAILDEQGNPVWPQTESVAVEYGFATEDAGEEVVEGDSIAEGSAETVEEIPAEEGSAQQREGTVISSVAEDAAVESGTSPSAVKRYSLKMGENTYTMLVSGGMQPVNQALGILHEIFPYILGISIGAAIILSLATSLYLTVPIVRLSQISRSMAALDFGNLYQGKRTDEVGVLGKNLNELSENLSRTLTKLRQANEKLKSDIEIEREAERKRIAFFSAVSHELKTPITILKGHLSGMIQGIGEYRNREYYLKRSQETAEKMEGLVKELLTVSRIENNKFTVQDTDIAEQVRQQLADMTELMEQKEIALWAELPEQLYAKVNQRMMEKVFCNLLINAINYTPEKEGNEIRILLAAGERDSGIKFYIENTGTSLPKEALPHLFEAFYRVEQSRNSQTGGSGLGLYIVKMILDQHGAKYKIENTENGVKFSFCL